MDELLIKKAKKGDSDSLYKLISLIKNDLYRVAFSYLKNEEDSLEAIQEASYRIFKNISKLKNPKYFKTWAIRIIINYCCDELKRRNKVVVTNKSIDKINDFENKAEELTLKMYLSELDLKYREVLILKYFEGYSIKEIAYLLSIPEGTVKTRLSRGLGVLEKKLNGGLFNE